MFPASAHWDRGRESFEPARLAESSLPTGENANGWVRFFLFTFLCSVQRAKKRFSTARRRRMEDHLTSTTLSKLGFDPELGAGPGEMAGKQAQIVIVADRHPNARAGHL